MTISARWHPALRVAAVTTLAVAAVYAGTVALILHLVSVRLVHETDDHLRAALAGVQTSSASLSLAPGSAQLTGSDTDDAPVFSWQVAANGAVRSLNKNAPALPAKVSAAGQLPRTVEIDAREVRIDAAVLPDGSRLFVGQSLVQQHHITTLLIRTATIVSAPLLIGIFVVALLVGRQASKPAERARQRQLEFTADASHELRTPLTVIDAEVAVALASQRSAQGYRSALERVSNETERLRRIVEDLIWLSRFDSEPPPPTAELIDVGTVAQQCGSRFAQVARLRGVELTIDVDASLPATLAAAPEWIDRLIGVLLDNALRYANDGGRVVLRVEFQSGRVTLAVDDDGPGIPVEERERLFARFHRAENATGPGAGLGLAIADAIVTSTRGRWNVTTSPLGGARFAVSWPARSHPHAAPKGIGVSQS